MDRKYYQDDEFEQFLQDEVKQHRMYPADHVWNNIRTELHGNPAWPALTFISLLIISSLAISTLLIAPSSERFRFAPVKALVITKTVEKDTRVHAPSAKEAYFNEIEPNHLTQATIAKIAVPAVVDEQLPAALPFTDNSLAIAAVNAERKERTNIINVTEIDNLTPVIIHQRAYQSNEPALTVAAVKETVSATDLQSLQKTMAEQQPNLTIQDELLKSFAAANKVSPRKPSSKIGFQFYVTPSKSYRSLSDDAVKEIIQPSSVNSATSQNIPLSLNYTAGVNDIVRNRPAMGLEVGFAALYNITSRIKFKAGVQMNVRQYYIETFRTLTPNITTVSLLNNRSIENLNLFSSYNNNAGFKATQLENRTYQLSVPIGLELNIFKSGPFGLNVETSVQPTYALNSNTYLLSTDFKNYTDGGSGLMRRWNINTSAGINLSFKSGSNIWQLGPQIRYQHLPTYSNRYPIKEQLIDYGIRLAFTKQR